MKLFNNEWMTVKGDRIGPEIGIGHRMHVTDTNVPVMISKSCIGNRALGWDLLPPGSGGFEFNDAKGVTWMSPGYKGTLERCSPNTKMLSWSYTPLLVMLQIVDPDMKSGIEPLGEVETNLILAKQLITHGANVNAPMIPYGETPLHSACFAGAVTNLDFIELLLKEGANPNNQSPHVRKTPMMGTATEAPGAAKCMLNWPTTDVNLTLQSGETFLKIVRYLNTCISEENGFRDNRDQVRHEFMLQQWREILEMLVEK